MKSKNGLSTKKVVEITTKEQKLEPADIADLALQIDEPELDETKRKLLAYLLLPQGALASTSEKAAMCGVKDRRIRQIQAEPGFRELCVKHVKLNIGKVIPEVWQALVTNAMQGDTQAQLTILRETGAMEHQTEKRVHSGKITNEIDVSKQVKEQIGNILDVIGMPKDEDMPHLDNSDDEGEK